MARPLTPDEVRYAVALLRVRANRAMDPLFAALADAVERLVLRRANTVDGIPVLDAIGAAQALAEIRSALDAIGPDVVATIRTASADAAKLAIVQAARLTGFASAGAFDARSPAFVVSFTVDAASVRVVRQAAFVLRAAVESGADARDVATRLGKFFDPKYAPYRMPDGRLVRADVRGALTDWPAASGMGSSPFRQISNHELTQRHREQTKAMAARDGHGVLWVLAAGHEDADTCDANATIDNGYGPGVWLPSQVPDIPHYGCLCTQTIVPLEDAAA